MDPALQAIHDVFVEAVLAGGARVLGARRAGLVGARYKDATELVTEADRQSDAAILAVLEARLPAIDSSLSVHLEESGVSGTPGRRRIGADPLDGTNHFAAGGHQYSVQAHYIDDGEALVGVIFQPEVYLPLYESEHCVGRLVSAIRDRGARVKRSVFRDDTFDLGDGRSVMRTPRSADRPLAACVPISKKMAAEERALAQRVYDSGVIGITVGTGGAGGNVMMTVFGGEDVYANFGAGEDLDLASAQVVAEEAGLVVWGPDRQRPLWHVRKQPFIVAHDEAIAERFLRAAGL